MGDRESRLSLALGHRDFRLLWSGQAVSMLGDSMFAVALGWTAFSLHGSGALAIVLLVESLGLLSTLLLGGVLADRYPRRRQMVASDLARAVVVAGLAASAWSGSLTFPLLCALALLQGLGAGFFHPAFGGMVPLVVDGPALPSANALIGVVRHGSFLLGPALAGLLYGPIGAGGVFALDACSFVVSAVLVWRTRPRTVERQESGEGTFGEIGDGLRYVGGIPWLWVTIALFSVFLMLILAPMQALLPQLVADEFHRGVRAYGFIWAAMGAGMLVGTVLFGRRAPSRRRGVLSYVIWTVNCTLVVVLALAPWYPLAVATSAARGVLVGFGVAIWDTMLMQRVPERMLSRVISLDFFGSVGLMPVGFVLAGALASVASPRAIIATGAAVTGLLFAAQLPSRWLREVE